MNRLFKYILLLIIAACGLACSEEVDLTTYKALEIEYVTSNRQAISNLRQWHGEDSYSIIADTYQENSNRGSLFVYPDVSTFGLWFQGCENLTEVYIPGGISSIGLRAFEKCANLKSVTTPESLSYIGIYAFKECECLESITIPDSVTTIGRWAFEDCSSLTSVYCAATTPPVLGGTGVFDKNASGRKIYVPTMSVYAYKSAEYWSSYADAIVGYNFETGEVDKDPLDELTNNKIYYTNGSTTTPTEPYDSSVFGANIVSNRYDSSLKCWAITFDADLTMIGDYAFYFCSSLTSVTIPDSVTTIGEGAFGACSNLTRVTIPDSVMTIGEGAFGDCSSLTSITIPDSVTTIGNGAFALCTSLTSVTIPDSVTTIGNSAFAYCSSLTSVTIPDSVTTIGNLAFYDCDSLASVYCKATIPPSLGGSSVFDNNASGRLIYVPAASVDAYKSAGYWSEYSDAILGYYFETGEEVMPDEMRNRVIYYTATRKVEANSSYPWAYDTFGANVVSNEWNSKTGEGVITFDAEVTTIGDDAFCNCESLTSVTIPDSVTTIGDSAFNSCESLTSVTIGDSVTTIGDYAFDHCKNLTSVTIPDSVTTIGDYAFFNCDSLTSVIIPDSVTTIGNLAFYDCDSLASVYCKATIPPSLGGSSVFDNNASGRLIYVPAASVDAYKSAGYWIKYADAIVGYNFETGEEVMPDEMQNRVICYTATAKVEAHNDYPWSFDTFGANIVSNEWNSESGEGVITFDADVTTIGYSAFYDCDSLTSVTIPDSVTTIGGWAFSSCDSLAEFKGKFAEDNGRILVVDGTLVAFAPSGLTEYAIPDSVTTIGDAAFSNCTSLTSVTIPDSVTTIGERAFEYCESLTSVTIGDSVTTIGYGAFAFCSNLTSITIPDSVTTIGGYAFDLCSSLTSVTIPDSVTTIGGSAFSQCSSLTNVTIGDSVTTIGQDAFRHCYSLASVYCESTTPPSLGGNAIFDNNASGRTIYVPAASVEAYKTADYWSEYADAIVGYDFETGEEVMPDEMRNRVIYYTATVKVEGYSDYPWTYGTFGANVVSNEWNSETGEGVITFDAEVTTIGDYAFAYCYNSLKSVTIPDSVTTIGDCAFYNCSGLTSVTIPGSVTTIGNKAFYYCENLTSVTIGDSVTTIGDSAFRDCDSLTSVTIPDSVTTIGERAFSDCFGITSVSIPDSVTTIGAYAFSPCDSLTSVYCTATTPPALGGSVFFFNGSGRKIYVPSQSVESYKSAEYWSNYADAIVGYDFNTTITPDGGIDDAEEDDEVIL